MLYEWLRDNTELVSTLITMVTLLVWVVWLQLMYSDYRSRRQPRMLIHQTRGVGVGSHCLLVNLSQEVIHILCVRATVQEDGNERSVQLGSESFSPNELGPRELENAIRQGPLGQGEFMRLGSFEEILEGVIEHPLPPEQGEDRDWERQASTVEIRVVAVYGQSDRSVGARRRFTLERRGGNLRVRPADIYTEQLFSRRGRRMAEGWLRDCLEV